MKQQSDEEIIAMLREADVPEPSPLFWDHLSQRVREAVAAEPVPTAGWTTRFNLAWSVGVFGVLAAAVMAVVITTHRGPQPAKAVASPVADDVAVASAVLPPLEDDVSLAVIGEIASEMDLDEVAAAGLAVTPGSAAGVIGQLSQDEQRAAVELLQQAITNSKSL